MEKIKTKISYVDPDTNEAKEENYESEVACSVCINNAGDSKVEVKQIVVGGMNLNMLRAMIEALIMTCREVLKEAPPELAKLIILTELTKAFKEEDKEDVAGESSESEEPSEQ